MRKWIGLLIVISILVAGPAWPQNLKALKKSVKALQDTARGLDERVGELERSQPMAVMPSDLGLSIGPDYPTEPGDIRIVQGDLVEINYCESDTPSDLWDVVSGAATLAQSVSTVFQGDAAMQVIVTSAPCIIRCSLASPVDIHDSMYLKIQARKSISPAADLTLHFGHDAYNENTSGIKAVYPYGYQEISYNISAISEASKTEVNFIGIEFSATGVYHIDYIRGDPGPSEIWAFDGDRLIRLAPRIYHGSYTSTGSALTITIPRKGTPSYIEIQRDHATDAPCVYWQKEFGAGNVLLKSAAGAFVTNRIDAVGDCYFTLGTDSQVNAETPHDYYFTVKWED